MRATSSAAVAVIALGLCGWLLTACGPEVSAYHEDCVDLCGVLVGECELPGYQSSSCVPNCEKELDGPGGGHALLSCYRDAACSTIALIECKRLAESDRL